MTAGFQNVEMMGCAPISVGEIPEGFDIRNASLSDLKRLREGKLTPSELKVYMSD